MKSVKIETWIKCLGQTYEELLENALLADEDFIELFPDDEFLYLEPVDGIAMRFWAKTERLEAIFITLIKSTPDDPIYDGELPYSIVSGMDQTSVHALLGQPLKAVGPMQSPEPLGVTGGWESYKMDSKTHPNINITFQYRGSMDVKVVVFALSDKGR